MSKNASNAPSISCSSHGLQRPRYFPRQLITPTEMNLEQEYFRNRLRLHNRMLHGWGVVCGALVCRVPKAEGQANESEPWLVKVTKGYILGPYGDEILIDCERKVDLRKACVSDAACTGSAEETVDPWCSEVFIHREGGSLWVAVKYAERAARPVRSHPTGCGCDDTECEYSRWCDGYEICLLDRCPESHQGTPSEPEFEGPNPDCPACPSEPWVVLAEVEFDADGTILKIDNCSCRRLVLGLGNFWWRCEERASPVEGRAEIEAVRPQGRLVPGATVEVVVRGRNLDSVHSVSLADGVVAALKSVEAQKLVLEVKVNVSAPAGPRTMVLRDARGRFIARMDNALVVEAARRPAANSKRAAKKAAKKAPRKKKAAKKG